MIAAEKDFTNMINDALNRLRRAHHRGTGCHLTRDMIIALSCSFIGEVWASDDPRGIDDDD